MRFPPDSGPSSVVEFSPEPAVPDTPFTVPVFGDYWPIAAMAGLVMVNLFVQILGRPKPKKDQRLFRSALDRFDAKQKEAERIAALPEVVEAKALAEQARGERDAALGQIKTLRREYGEERLQVFAQRVQRNLEFARLKKEYPEEQLKEVRVTVRFAVYADLGLAQEIERILKKHTGWPVELDGSNKPTLLPSEKGFKVLFDIGPMESFMAVAVAFDEGRLVDASIGVRRSERWGESERLVVEVLPITP
jgi:hypothetical protein